MKRTRVRLQASNTATDQSIFVEVAMTLCFETKKTITVTLVDVGQIQARTDVFDARRPMIFRYSEDRMPRCFLQHTPRHVLQCCWPATCIRFACHVICCSNHINPAHVPSNVKPSPVKSVTSMSASAWSCDVHRERERDRQTCF